MYTSLGHYRTAPCRLRGSEVAAVEGQGIRAPCIHNRALPQTGQSRRRERCGAERMSLGACAWLLGVNVNESVDVL